jgi:hypothetical protein
MAFLVPIFAGIGAAVTTVSGLLATGGIGATLLRVGGSLLLSSIAQKKAQSRARAAAQSTGVTGRNVTVREPVRAMELVYGRVRKAGVITFLHTEGPQLYLVIALAAHRVQSIGNIYFDGELAADVNGTIQTRFAMGNSLRIEKALGDVDQSAFPLMRSEIPSFWGVEHRMRGVAGIALRLTFDANIYPNGLPNITCDIEGKNDILDPRTSLRGWSENPALVLADYMSLQTQISVGAVIGAPDGIDSAALIEAANICDETVAKIGGGSEPRYTCNGVVSLSVGPRDNIESLLTAMAGEAAWQGGVWYIRAGAYRMPTATLTVDEARGSMTMQTRISAAENCNAVRGTFISPENDWQPDDFPAIKSDVYLAEDKGDRRWRDIELPFTTSASMAQRLAKIELEKVRRQITVRYPGKLSAWRAAVTDTVALTHPRWGLNAKPFEVVALTSEIAEDGSGQPILVPDLVLRETSPLIYDWSATEEQIYAAAPRTNLPNSFDIVAPGILSAVESLYVTRAGDGVKTQVAITLSPSPSVNLRGYEVEGRLGAGPWVSVTRNGGETAVEMLDAAPGDWQFRARSFTILGARSAWSEVFSLNVLGLAAPPAALTGASILQIGGQAVLKWDLPPELDVRVAGHVVIRHSTAPVPTWAGGLSVAQVAGASTTVIVPLMPGSYMLRAQDSTDNLGPVTVLSAEGIQALPFAPIGTLQEDDEFAGVHGGTFQAAGALQLGSGVDIYTSVDLFAEPDLWIIGGQLLLNGTYQFAAGFDFGLVKTVRLRRVVRMIPVRIDGNIWVEPELWGMADIYGSVSDDVDVRVEIATTPDDPSAAPVWSPWRLLEADEVTARGVRARAILSTTNPLVTPLVDHLRIEAHEVTL